MKVLSLFDGMACGMLAMQKAGIQVERYVAFEIDKYAIQTSSHNFPMIEHRGDVFQADFTEFIGFDFLIGGSPCTFWSIAQKNNRETVASGMGWELFSQYVRALHEAQPMYFIYENNKSMSAAIRASITETFGFEPDCINSALLSAQNRWRLYWVGKRNPDGTYSKVHVEQPEDLGILLKDILDSATGGQAIGIGYRGRMENGKWVKRYESNGEPKANALTTCQYDSMVAETIRVGALPRPNGELSTSQAFRIYSVEGKSVNITAGGGGAGGKTGLYAIPIQLDGFAPGESTGNSKMEFLGGIVGNHEKWLDDGKNFSRNFSQGHRLYGINGKAVTQTAQPCGHAGNTGLYAIPVEFEGDIPVKVVSGSDNKDCLVYEVKGGFITIKEKQYPIKLQDGFYIIRKLTVSECKRLQTVPEWYEFPVSDTQSYKMLGNGWTVDVIAHLINATQTDQQEDGQISMFELGC